MVHGVLDLSGIFLEAVEGLGLDEGRVHKCVGSRMKYADCLGQGDAPRLCTTIRSKRDDAQLAAVYPGPVGIVLGAQPLGQHVGSLDEQELAIAVGHPHPQVWELLGELTQDVDNEPFILYRVSVVGDAVEMCEACYGLSVRPRGFAVTGCRVARTFLGCNLDIKGVPLPDVATGEPARKLHGGLSHGVEAREDLLGLKLGIDDEQHVLDTVLRQRSFEALETAIRRLCWFRTSCICHFHPTARPEAVVAALVCPSCWPE